MDKIGIVDTMFARIDMGTIAENKLASFDGYGSTYELVRRTVPGFKDLAVAAKILIDREGCNIVVACGMPGGAELDKQCAHEAAQGIMLAQLLTGVHILEVFVHLSEEPDPRKFAELCRRRVEGHALNAWRLLYAQDELRRHAGMGVRQGSDDAGPIELADLS